MPEFIPIVHETADLTITGSAFEIASLKLGETAFSNRPYQLRGIPADLRDLSFTRLPGGTHPILEVTAKTDTTLRIATATDQEPIDLTGWQPESIEFSYTDPDKTRLHLHTRRISKGTTLRLPATNWTGPLLILPAR